MKRMPTKENVSDLGVFVDRIVNSAINPKSADYVEVRGEVMPIGRDAEGIQYRFSANFDIGKKKGYVIGNVEYSHEYGTSHGETHDTKAYVIEQLNCIDRLIKNRVPILRTVMCESDKMLRVESTMHHVLSPQKS